jgi:hypothetical protein
MRSRRRRSGQRHKPGALNVVAEDSDEQVRAALPDTAAAIVTYSTDRRCTRGPELAARLRELGYGDVRTYTGGIEDWIAAGLPVERPGSVTLTLSDLALGPTASLFEGSPTCTTASGAEPDEPDFPRRLRGDVAASAGVAATHTHRPEDAHDTRSSHRAARRPI